MYIYLMHGYDLREAFQNSPASIEDGVKLNIDNPNAYTLIERTDTRGNVAYGMRHTPPTGDVKIFNESRHPQSSIALSFASNPTSYDDILKVVKRPTGGYELHLQKINTVVIDGKRIDLRSLSSFLPN